jgi:hypothetical protein
VVLLDHSSWNLSLSKQVSIVVFWVLTTLNPVVTNVSEESIAPLLRFNRDIFTAVRISVSYQLASWERIS